MKPSDYCTPAEELALDLERLAEAVNKLRERHRHALTRWIDVSLSDMHGELRIAARQLGPDVVLPSTRAANP